MDIKETIGTAHVLKASLPGGIEVTITETYGFADALGISDARADLVVTRDNRFMLRFDATSWQEFKDAIDYVLKTWREREGAKFDECSRDDSPAEGRFKS